MCAVKQVCGSGLGRAGHVTAQPGNGEKLIAIMSGRVKNQELRAYATRTRVRDLRECGELALRR